MKEEMTTIYRAEKQTDPAKMPGQIVNPIPQAKSLAEYIAHVQAEERCCHKTVIERCEGCPYAAN